MINADRFTQQRQPSGAGRQLLGVQACPVRVLLWSPASESLEHARIFYMKLYSAEMTLGRWCWWRSPSAGCHLGVRWWW